MASVDTYMRFAEAVIRLDLRDTQTSGLPELMEDLTDSDSDSGSDSGSGSEGSRTRKSAKS